MTNTAIETLRLYKIVYNELMQAHTKPVEFLGSALPRRGSCTLWVSDLRDFPLSVRREAGYQIDKVQHGEEPDDWKPIKTIGAGVQEIRLQDEAGAFRVIYVAKLKDAIYVLHCFQKKTQRTAAHDIALASKRYNELMRGAK